MHISDNVSVLTTANKSETSDLPIAEPLPGPPKKEKKFEHIFKNNEWPEKRPFLRMTEKGITPDRQQSIKLILLTKVDQKFLETEFLIAICSPTNDKWLSKTLFLAIYDPSSSIVNSACDCRLPCV